MAHDPTDFGSSDAPEPKRDDDAESPKAQPPTSNDPAHPYTFDASLAQVEHEDGALTSHQLTNSEAATDSKSAPDVLLAQSVEFDQPNRLHPFSPVFDIVAHARSYIWPAILAILGAASGGPVGGYIALAIAGPAILVSFIRYFTLQYRIRDGELIVSEGLLNRRHRTVPVERIQNIDLVQNPLHRIFKLAEVRVETASGTEPEAILRVLSLDHVTLLRNEIFHQRSAVAPSEPSSDPSVSAPDAPATLKPELTTQLLTIPASWLVKAGLASNRGMLILGLAFGLVYQLDQFDSFEFDWVRTYNIDEFNSVGAILGILGIVIGVLLLLRLLGIIWYLLRFYDYRLSRHGEDFRIECGLLTRVSATIPQSRVQFISQHQNFILRLMGLTSIRLETAGGAGTENEDAAATVSRRWFVPVCKTSFAPTIISALRPGFEGDLHSLKWQRLPRKATRRLLRIALVQSLVVAAIGIAITRPWGFLAGVGIFPLLAAHAILHARSLMYTRFENGVGYRSGILSRKTSVTFFDKIQTLRIDQTPFDRRWRMATLSVDTAASGPAEHRIRIPMLEQSFALAEYQALLDRSSVSSKI